MPPAVPASDTFKSREGKPYYFGAMNQPFAYHSVVFTGKDGARIPIFYESEVPVGLTSTRKFHVDNWYTVRISLIPSPLSPGD